MSEENELLFDELYEKTKDCGRVQFIKLLMQKERENQELKLELSGYRQAILNDKEMLGLKEENQELKKQLEEINYTCVPNSNIKNVIDKYKNQQKEFISYLENEMKSWTEAINEEHDYELVQEFALKCNIYEEILSKYKEIIGGKDENI